VTRPLVKICGVTTPEDAALAVRLGADLLGVNFHPPSPRALDPAADAARLLEIADAAGGPPSDRSRKALLAGVFVHRPPGEIEEIVASARLDLVQLHGDHHRWGAEEAARFGERAIRVFRRAGAAELAAIAAELPLHPPVWGFLFDTPPPARRAPRTHPAADSWSDPFGGTGESWDHGALRKITEGPAASAGRPVLVAGGIRPGNARAALAASGARGIDVCSGVESAPGVKDPDLLRRLFEEIDDGSAAS
jgi:phosphoribosylanthranilate isomerase